MHLSSASLGGVRWLAVFILSIYRAKVKYFVTRDQALFSLRYVKLGLIAYLRLSIFLLAQDQWTYISRLYFGSLHSKASTRNQRLKTWKKIPILRFF